MTTILIFNAAASWLAACVLGGLALRQRRRTPAVSYARI